MPSSPTTLARKNLSRRKILREQDPLVTNHTPPTHTTIPTRDDILAFIKAGAAKGQTLGKREIAKAFALKGEARIALKRQLRALFDEGALEKRHKSLLPSGQLPPVLLVDITTLTSDGDLLATPVEWDTALQGVPPAIFIHTPRRPQPKSLARSVAPAVGQRALVRVSPQRADERGKMTYHARVIKLVAKEKTARLGVLRLQKDGSGLLSPIEKKGQSQPLFLPREEVGDVEDGSLLSVDVLPAGRFGQARAKIREVIGSVADESAISLIALANHNIPYVFPDRVVTEAERLNAAKLIDIPAREDWRALPLITIDPFDARDHDDAVHACYDDDPANAGGFVVTVAIADVAAFVRPNTALDKEALVRGNSVYFPGRVVPMLPERISNDLCSLRPAEDRAALAVKLVLDKGGHKLRHSFHRILMRSAHKLSYEQAQAIFDKQCDEALMPLREPLIAPLYAAYRAAISARAQRAPLNLDLPERKITLDAAGKIASIYVPERLEAHKLIEEFMILANVAAAETLEQHKTPLIYRVHDAPTAEKLRDLAEFLKTLDISFAKGDTPPPSRFNAILAKVKDTAHEALVNEVVLRCQAQAEYSAKNYGHYGLHLRRYAHFTSPIRRYADLIVHRALIAALKFGEDGLTPEAAGALEEISATISACERRAMRAERETVERLIASHLAAHIGATFAGRISGVTSAGLFIRLDETGADGFIPAVFLGAQHGGDYLHHDAGSHSLSGRHSRAHYQLGDKVMVRLVEALPMAGALRFEMAENCDSVGVSGFGLGGAGKPKRTKGAKPNFSSARKRK